MASYRAYFRDRQGEIVGRDDFEAADDIRAMIVARKLRDACSDCCATFELWDGARHVSKFPRETAVRNLEDVAAEVQTIVLEREMAIRDSDWMIADSSLLLERAGQLLEKVRTRLPLAG
jgi:hypothetical protein